LYNEEISGEQEPAENDRKTFDKRSHYFSLYDPDCNLLIDKFKALIGEWNRKCKWYIGVGKFL
jgi:hypothetical protein